MGKGSARRPSQVSHEEETIRWNLAMTACEKTKEKYREALKQLTDKRTDNASRT